MTCRNQQRQQAISISLSAAGGNGGVAYQWRNGGFNGESIYQQATEHRGN